MPFPPVPPEIKGIAHYLKVAEEHDDRNAIISYWCRMYACQNAMKLVPGKKSPEVSAVLMSVMDCMEKAKDDYREVDGISDEVAAAAIIEEYALQLFNYADSQDRQEIFNKNVVKSFYTAAILMDILTQFGEVSEDIQEKKQYAKYKAASIHSCLKNGVQPFSGNNTEYPNHVIHKSEIVDPPPLDIKPGPRIPPTPTDPPQPPLVVYKTPTSQPTTPVTPQPVAPQTPVNVSSGPVFPSANPETSTSADVAVGITPEQIEKAQKHCKFATSALTYDDIKTAVDNLQKALTLLQLGKE